MGTDGWGTRTVVVAVLALWASSGAASEPEKGPKPGRLFALSVAANVADYGTTLWAVERGHREGNPVTALAVERGPVAFGLYKAAAVAGPELGARWLERRGHRGGAKVARVAAIVLPGLMAVSNARLAASGAAPGTLAYRVPR